MYSPQAKGGQTAPNGGDKVAEPEQQKLSKLVF